MPARIHQALAAVGFIMMMIGSASAENTTPIPDIIHDHGYLRVDTARGDNDDRFIAATLRNVDGTAEIVVECLPNKDLLSGVILLGLVLDPEEVRALSIYVDNQRAQFSVRSSNDSKNTIAFVDIDHLRAVPKRTRRFVETLWKGNAAILQVGERRWQFDLSSSRIGLLLISEACNVDLS